MQNEDFINEFIAEGRDHMAVIEPDLLALERDGANVSPELVNRLFRAMHSIKGASSFFGFIALTEVSHAMESVLVKFRDGYIVPNPDNIDALLAGADKVNALLENIHTGEQVDSDEEICRLKEILEGNKEDIVRTDDQIPPETSPTESLSHEFCLESQKEIADIIEDIIVWNQDDSSESRQIISKGYRGILSIVNGATFVGAEDVHRLGTVIKDVLQKLRDAQIIADYDTKDCILDALSKLQIMVEDIAHSSRITYDDEIYRLQQLLFGQRDQKISIPPPKISETSLKNKSGLDPEQSSSLPPKSSSQPTSSKRSSDAEASAIKTSGSSETIRISVDLIDKMMNLAGELVLGRNQLRLELEQIVSKNPKLSTIIQNVDVVTSEIQESIMRMRMQPIGNLLNKFNRIVRDLSRQLAKDVELIIEGKDVELDKTILEGLSDPLTHLIRNALDHGIETPEEREEMGKPIAGMLQIKTFHEGGQVNILVSDDGRGINLDRLVEKAIANGIASPDRAVVMTEKEKLGLILLPGMSTAENVTDLSGRGVGMDVVKTNIERLGGYLDLETHENMGTQFRIRLPLTLAIIPSLIVGAGGHRFAIPQVNVRELILIRAGEVTHRIEKIGTSEVLRLREKLLPLVRLSDILGLDRFYENPVTGEVGIDRRCQICDRRQADPDTDQLNGMVEKRQEKADRRVSRQSDISVVVLRMGPYSFGLNVDELFDNEEIVVKPLSEHIKDCKCFAGATIMGDGRVAMILDATGIAEYANLSFSEISAEENRRIAAERKTENIAAQSEAILLFNNAYEEYFALPLDDISRLEKIEPEEIHSVGNRRYIDYLGEGLPLIQLDAFLPVGPFPAAPEEYYVIIPKLADTVVGILVSRILDTVNTTLNIKKEPATPKGILGTAFIDGQLTHFLNTEELMQLVNSGSSVHEFG